MLDLIVTVENFGLDGIRNATVLCKPIHTNHNNPTVTSLHNSSLDILSANKFPTTRLMGTPDALPAGLKEWKQRYDVAQSFSVNA